MTSVGTFCIFLKKIPKIEMIEILIQEKVWYPEWHETMVNANIDIFEVSFDESVS
jgi:hypothetical protein